MILRGLAKRDERRARRGLRIAAMVVGRSGLPERFQVGTKGYPVRKIMRNLKAIGLYTFSNNRMSENSETLAVLQAGIPRGGLVREISRLRSLRSRACG